MQTLPSYLSNLRVVPLQVAGLKSLANHRLRSYHTYKIWCGGADEGLIECGKAQEWFTDYFDSELVTVCKGKHLRDTM